MRTFDPIIVIGMHRSGTSLLSRLLEQLGVHMGHVKDQNNEAQFFLKLNEWVIRQSGGAWDRPESIKAMLENPLIRPLLVKYLSRMLHGYRFSYYLGPKLCLRRNSASQMKTRWGWKDPRNTFTLDLWLELFPQARVIHIYRNGVDVSRSLLSRGRLEIENARNEAANIWSLQTLHLTPFPPKGRGHMIFRDYPLVQSVKCLERKGAFNVWEKYIEQALIHKSSLGPKRFFEIRYEDLLLNPEQELSRLVEYLQQEMDVDEIEKLSGTIDPMHSEAFRANEEWTTFFETVRHTPYMKALNYD